MSKLDQDLLSLQQTRDFLGKAHEAQKKLAEFDQGQIDRIVEAMADAAYKAAEALAELAVSETGIGIVKDKIEKNRFASRVVWESIKAMPTVGIIHEDTRLGIVEIAEPMGVVAGIIPTTNPTSTIIFKTLIALKARCGIVMSPHPRAIRCSLETTRVMAEAALAAGAPEGIIHCIELPTREATQELMTHKLTSIILATGGSQLVKASYSSGKPAFGVGPGNVPAFIERSADLEQAVADIIFSKTFDNGTICASEQALITERVIADRVMEILESSACYRLSAQEVQLVAKTVMMPGGGVNPQVVGQSAETVAEMAGVKVPAGTRILIAPLDGVGKAYPLSAEKLCPVLAFYVEEDWQGACERSFELLEFGGLGHSLAIHSKNRDIIMEFAMKKPVFRILVNTPSSQGGIGQTTNLQPSLTLGCGTWGENVTADNVGPQHLLNTKRLAFPKSSLQDSTFTMEDIRRAVSRSMGRA